MPLPEKHPVRVTISITKSDYAYLKDWIEKQRIPQKQSPVISGGWCATISGASGNRELLEKLSSS